jgi:hypothetical protein
VGILVVLFLLLVFIQAYCRVPGINFWDLPGEPFWIAVALFFIGGGLVMLSFFIEELARLFFVIGEVF